MKIYIILILTIISCNFCYSQQVDKEIEAIKKEIIGNWKESDTTSLKVKYRFTSKKITVIVYCQGNTVLKRTMNYSLKKEYINELKRDVIVLALPAKAKKLTSHDCDICREKTLDHSTFYDWYDLVIKNNKLTSCYDNSKKDCTTLIKE